MKNLILVIILLAGAITAAGQISITADSMIVSKWDLSKEINMPVNRIKENISLEIDKDLLTLIIKGKTEEKSYIEKAYLIDLLEVNDNMSKWLFQGSDKNNIPYTITIDLDAKKISFVTFLKEVGIPKPLNTIYYPIVDIRINKEAIQKHLLEKGQNRTQKER